MNDNFENKTICSKCNGKCCKQFPGIVDAGDVTDNNIVDMLFSGDYAVDYWEGDPREGFDDIYRGYFIRPKTKDKKDRLVDASWGGECVFFVNGNGCELEPSARPYQCRILEPKADFKCQSHGKNKRSMCVEWIKYHDLIDEIIDLIES